jgi:hypothetical protein
MEVSSDWLRVLGDSDTSVLHRLSDLKIPVSLLPRHLLFSPALLFAIIVVSTHHGCTETSIEACPLRSSPLMLVPVKWLLASFMKMMLAPSNAICCKKSELMLNMIPRCLSDQSMADSRKQSEKETSNTD